LTRPSRARRARGDARAHAGERGRSAVREEERARRGAVLRCGVLDHFVVRGRDELARHDFDLVDGSPTDPDLLEIERLAVPRAVRREQLHVPAGDDVDVKADGCGAAVDRQLDECQLDFAIHGPALRVEAPRLTRIRRGGKRREERQAIARLRIQAPSLAAAVQDEHAVDVEQDHEP
jgi:hypothetical protein